MRKTHNLTDNSSQHHCPSILCKGKADICYTQSKFEDFSHTFLVEKIQAWMELVKKNHPNLSNKTIPGPTDM